MCKRERESEGAGDREIHVLLKKKKMDLCNLSLCVKYNLLASSDSSWERSTQIRRDIVREEFYLCLLYVSLYHLD